MIRAIFIVLAILSSVSFAQQPCYELLRGRAQRQTVTRADLESVKGWLHMLSAPTDYYSDFYQQPDFQNYLAASKVNWPALNDDGKREVAARYLVSQWDIWNGINDTQRQFAMTQELKKLGFKGRSHDNVSQLNDSDLLLELSAKNLERMLSQLLLLYPIPLNKLKNNELNRLTESMAANLEMNFVRPSSLNSSAVPGWINYPVVSPRELKSLGLDNYLDFYSILVDTAYTARFSAVFTNKEVDSPWTFGNLLGRESLVLNPSFAEHTEAFVIPQFNDPIEVIDFFDFWDPKVAGQQFHHVRAFLPQAVTDYDEYINYLVENSINVYPKALSYHQLSPMRTQLINYVLTVKDAKIFFKKATQYWLMVISAKNPDLLERVSQDWNMAAQVTDLMRKRLMQFLHMTGGVSIRVASGVPASRYSIVRVEPIGSFNPSPGPKIEPFYDPRRLDHSKTP